jgi:two-component system response regulator AtoC
MPFAATYQGTASPQAPRLHEITSGPLLLDPEMVRLYQTAARVALGDISVLILGETGSGKESLAETIHQHSRRAGGPFLRVNCASLSETLLQSELFGHERGAFTGALTARPGLLQAAHGGTVFLDEAGEMPLSLQAALLRVMESGEVLRVGARQATPIDVRFVSATNRDLEGEVARGVFRKDLYYRLNGVALTVPPLRRRRGEIAALAQRFAGTAARGLGLPRTPELPVDTLDRLLGHSWPGNVRELRNAIEAAVLLCPGDRIDPEHLPLGRLTAPATAPAAASDKPAGSEPDANQDPAGERDRIVRALEQCAGNQTRAAKLLGISRATLSIRLNDYRLPRPRKHLRAL